jgi:hypothetical protein
MGLRGSKPGERRGGRQKGTPNKVSHDLKTMILRSLDKVGGEDYLVKLSEKNPGAYATLLGKVLPMAMEHRGSLTINRVFYGDAESDEVMPRDLQK